MGMGILLREMGFRRTAGLVNHDITGDCHEFAATHERVEANLSEAEKSAFLEAWHPDIVLGDGVLMDMLAHAPDLFCHQVSNPNINRISLVDRTPHIGFIGLVHLCEVLCNGLVSKRAHVSPWKGEQGGIPLPLFVETRISGPLSRGGCQLRAMKVSQQMIRKGFGQNQKVFLRHIVLSVDGFPSGEKFIFHGIRDLYTVFSG